MSNLSIAQVGEMTGWYYLKEGFVDDSQIGPVNDATLLQLAFDGSLNPKTKVLHHQHTRGQWALLEQIPAAKKKIDEGERIQADKAAAARAAKEDQKREKLAAKEEARRQRYAEMAAKQAAAEVEHHNQLETQASNERTTADAIAAGGATPFAQGVPSEPQRIVASHSPIRDSAIETEVFSCTPAMFRNRPILYCLFLLLIVFFGFGALLLAAWWLRTLNTRLSITTKRTILRKGLLSKHTAEVRHVDVRYLQVNQRFLQRVLGVGSLAVSSAAQGSVEIFVGGIPHPEQAKEIINSYRL